MEIIQQTFIDGLHVSLKEYQNREGYTKTKKLKDRDTDIQHVKQIKEFQSQI